MHTDPEYESASLAQQAEMDRQLSMRATSKNDTDPLEHPETRTTAIATCTAAGDYSESD
jgi:hypothetical protein